MTDDAPAPIKRQAQQAIAEMRENLETVESTLAEVRRCEVVEGWTLRERERCEFEDVPMTRSHHEEPGNHDGPALLILLPGEAS